MKAALFLALVVGSLMATTEVEAAQDKTITKVVKLLQKMLTKSKEEGEADRLAYAKYACYVATAKAEKEESIKKLTEQIDLLESKIAELQATNGELAAEVAQLATDMTNNKAEQKQATEIREESEKNFKEMEEDLTAANGQMEEAIEVLSSIGFVQSKSSEGHEKFMAGSNKDKKKAVLLNMGSEAKNALRGAEALLTPEKRQLLEAFLQGTDKKPDENADAIIGILKDMLKTFKTNLENAKKTEKAEKEAFEASIKTLKESYDKLEKAHDAKEADMGSNDDELSAKMTQLDESKKQKESDEEFLEKLEEMSKEKAKDYEERKMLRANEDAAIAEAISILNNDEAFDTFGEVDATSTGATSFLQLRRRGGAVRQQAENLLTHAAGQSKSTRLARVAASLRKGNPFTIVLAEIDKIEKIIKEEGEADKEKKEWCEKERKTSEADLEAKKSEIKTLNGEIEKLDETINDPKTGLKVQIPEKEASIVENQKAQKEATETRKKENVAYKADVVNLVEAEDLLEKAIKVLNKYYKTLAARKSLMQQQEDPTPPETFESPFKGQSETGNKAIDMLEFILTETKKEHQTADDDEAKSLEEYEENMKELKKQEAEMQEALVKLKETLAEKEKELEEKQVDLKDAKNAKESIEEYLLKIKPGCDFIEENFDLREENRATELEALKKAKTLIKDTPAYKDAEKKDAALKAGKCKPECSMDDTDLKCKACMAGESEEDFCKANPRMAGCV